MFLGQLVQFFYFSLNIIQRCSRVIYFTYMSLIASDLWQLSWRSGMRDSKTFCRRGHLSSASGRTCGTESYRPRACCCSSQLLYSYFQTVTSSLQLAVVSSSTHMSRAFSIAGLMVWNSALMSSEIRRDGVWFRQF